MIRREIWKLDCMRGARFYSVATTVLPKGGRHSASVDVSGLRDKVTTHLPRLPQGIDCDAKPSYSLRLHTVRLGSEVDRKALRVASGHGLGSHPGRFPSWL